VSALVGVDVGTGGARALAVDEAGELLAQASSEYPLATPRAGWTEQDPEDWWGGVLGVLRQVAAAVDGDVAALGLTGQMHGSVFLDARGHVLRRALLWNDQRTAAQAAGLAKQVGEERLLAIAGNPALTGFQAPKLMWLRDEEPELYRRLAHVLLPKDYVRLRLCGELLTDASDASGTLLFDVGARSWSSELLDALELSREWLPEVREGPEPAGALGAQVAGELGLPAGIPIAAGGGDNAAAAVGVGVVRPGLISSSIGTSGVVFAHRDSFGYDPSGRVHACCHAVPNAWHLMGVTLAAGASLRWWRDQVASGQSYQQLEELAAPLAPGAEGLLFLPYLRGERSPHRDPSARGAFAGLTARHELGHLTRAVFEGVAFSLRDSLETFRELDVQIDEVRALGGGARSPLWRTIQADVFGAPVVRTVIDEGPAYGAALLAGVAVGFFADVPEAVTRVRLRDERDVPDPERSAHYEEIYALYRELYPATRDTMAGLTDLAAGRSGST
jgi:xylulokinase